MTTEAAPNTWELVYRGRRLNGKNRVVYEYSDPGKTGPLDGIWYLKPLRPGIRVGTMLRVSVTAGGQIYMGGEYEPKIIEGGVAPALVLEWQAADAAAATMKAELSAQTRLAQQAGDPLHEALDVIRAALRSQHGVAYRAAFSRYVDEYIHG